MKFKRNPEPLRSAARIRDFGWLVNGGLGVGEVLIWYDKLGISLPQAPPETNTMFHGNARHQLGHKREIFVSSFLDKHWGTLQAPFLLLG